jgi:hypothetical protein
MDLVLLNFKKPLFGTPYFLLYDRNHPWLFLKLS